MVAVRSAADVWRHPRGAFRPRCGTGAAEARGSAPSSPAPVRQLSPRAEHDVPNLLSGISQATEALRAPGGPKKG